MATVNTHPTLALDVGGVVVNNMDDIIDSYIFQKINAPQYLINNTWEYQTRLLITGQITVHDFWRNINIFLGKKVDPNNTFFTDMNEDHLAVDRDLVSYVKSIKRSHRVIAMSNSIAPISRYYENIGLFDIFDDLYLSERIGHSKPNSKFYEHVLKNEYSLAQDVVFIDDKVENVEAARELGFRTHFHKSFRNTREFIHQVFSNRS